MPILASILMLLGLGMVINSAKASGSDNISSLAYVLDNSRNTTTILSLDEGIDMGSVMTLEQIKYETTMNRWKQKQTRLWSNLPENDFTINASAYTAAVDECGKSDGITASGIKVEEKRTIACPPQYPFGATLKIDGMGKYVCEDRGGAIKGNKIDIYVETKKEAFAFGRRNLTARFIFEK